MRNAISLIFALFVLLLLACWCGLNAQAQDAKVVALSYNDTQMAKELVQDKKALDARVKEFKNHIVRDYLVTHNPKDGQMLYYDPDKEANTSLTGWLTINGTSLVISAAGSASPVCVDSKRIINYPCILSDKEKEEFIKKFYEQQNAAKINAFNEQKQQGWILTGWDNGEYEYSDDYKYIVPQKETLVNKTLEGGSMIVHAERSNW